MIERRGGARRAAAARVGYCANVRPGDTVDEVVDHVAGVAARVAAQQPGAPLRLGLFLGAAAARALEEDPAELERLQGALASAHAVVESLNGFPFAGFHDGRVKERVYLPDWTDEARVEHTLRLARLLARLVPPGTRRAAISTLPVAFRRTAAPSTRARAAQLLARTAGRLRRLRDEEGVAVRLALEPEPSCLVETARELVELFRAVTRAARGLTLAEEIVHDHLGACLDTCHHAVQFEDPEDVWATYRREGVPVGKVQLSSALEVRAPGGAARRALLAGWNEPRFLHQVRTRGVHGAVLGCDDLDDLGEVDLPVLGPWRVHFHVPVHVPASPTEPVGTTRDDMARYLLEDDLLAGAEAIEVETYTWSVLPDAARRGATTGVDPAETIDPSDDASLARGLVAELCAVRALLGDAGAGP